MIARIRRGRIRPFLGLMALVAFMAMPGSGFGTVGVAMAQVQDDLELAREQYERAQFDQALVILTRLLARADEPAERLRDAHVLQARCQVGLGQRELAEDSFCEALALDADWRPDPIFYPPAEIEVFNAAQEGCPAPSVQPESEVTQSRPWYMKPVVWAGGAAVILAAVLLSGGDDD